MRPPLLTGAAALLLAMAAAGHLAVYHPPEREGAVLGILAGHVLLFLAGMLLLIPRLPAAWRSGALGPAAASLGLGAADWLPDAPHDLLIFLHAAAALLAVLVVGLGMTRAGAGRRWIRAAAALLVFFPAAAYLAADQAERHWQPPRYRAAACYRFLTATTGEQSGEPLFPSALRLRGKQAGDSCSRCHARAHAGWDVQAHARAAGSRAYLATFADFARRRGAEAARWCRGCHEPGSLGGKMTAGHAEGVACMDCHGARDVHALYGSAALVTDSGAAPRGWSPAVRPKDHARTYLRPSLHRSVEFCGACHRKNWNLPQNAYHWMAGPDEYRDWLASRYSGSALFAPGDAATRRTCLDCHRSSLPSRAPGPEPAQSRESLALDVFIRQGAAVGPLDRIAPPASKAGLLDVVVTNTGIGHTFPTGMPDQREAWLEVTVRDRSGQVVARSGSAEPHRYALVGLDREGKPLAHGDLDRMTSVAEWRRIPAGESDLARCRLPTLPQGIGQVTVRLLRRIRPEFATWVIHPLLHNGGRAGRLESLPHNEVLAEATLAAGMAPSDRAEARRWRRYGRALANARAVPLAIQALRRAQDLAPDEPETLLCLGDVYLRDGDLLAAIEQFKRAAAFPVTAERARARQGHVLRLSQPDAASALLEPLVRRYPRDLTLRYELGRTYMAQLRSGEAAREFEAMLDVDPLDVSAHFNLMSARQRLNQLTEARREETIYRLLAPDNSAAGGGSLEDRPLHVHPLEAVQ